MADTRQKLIQTAHEAFYRQGFLSVGIDQIIADVGVTKTTFYNHFTSKDDLILAVLEYHDDWWQQTFCRMLREKAGLHPRAQLMAVFDVLRSVFDSDFKGCIFINAAVDFPGSHQPAHQAARRHKVAMEKIIRDLAQASGAERPDEFAEEFSLVMEGAYVTQHVSGGCKTAAIAQRLGAMLLQRHLPKNTVSIPKDA